MDEIIRTPDSVVYATKLEAAAWSAAHEADWFGWFDDPCEPASKLEIAVALYLLRKQLEEAGKK